MKFKDHHSEELINDKLSKSQWRELIAQWKESGLSQPAFCKERKITYHRFVYWRSKFLHNEGKSRPQLAKLKITEPPRQAVISNLAIKLVMPNGTNIFIPKGMDCATISVVLNELMKC